MNANVLSWPRASYEGGRIWEQSGRAGAPQLLRAGRRERLWRGGGTRLRVGPGISPAFSRRCEKRLLLRWLRRHQCSWLGAAGLVHPVEETFYAFFTLFFRAGRSSATVPLPFLPGCRKGSTGGAAGSASSTPSCATRASQGKWGRHTHFLCWALGAGGAKGEAGEQRADALSLSTQGNCKQGFSWPAVHAHCRRLRRQHVSERVLDTLAQQVGGKVVVRVMPRGGKSMGGEALAAAAEPQKWACCGAGEGAHAAGARGRRAFCMNRPCCCACCA